MLEFAKRLGKEKNCTDIHLTVNPNNKNAIKVYENFGMEVNNICSLGSQSNTSRYGDVSYILKTIDESDYLRK